MVEDRNDPQSLPSIPLYAAGFLTLFSAILAVSSALYSTQFTLAAVAVAITGNLISWLLRRNGYRLRILEIAVIGVVIIVYAKIATGDTTSEFLMPSATQSSLELKLAVLLLWIEIFRTFTLSSDDAVAFTAVPSIALLGLVATQNVNPEMLLMFLLYLIPSIFMLVHRASSDVKRLCGNEKLLFREQIRAAVTLGAIAAVIGSVTATPIRTVASSGFAAFAPQWFRTAPRTGMQGVIEPGVMPISQGPVRLSTVTVMIVRSDPRGALPAMREPLYWRGRVFDRYTGHGWRNSLIPERLDPSGVHREDDGNEYPLYTVEPQNSGSKEQLVQKFEILRSGVFTVYAASEPVTFWGRAERVSRDQANNWRSRMYGEYPIRYGVISTLPETDPDKLRAAWRVFSKPAYKRTDYDQWALDNYLQRKNSTLKAGELAKELTKDMRPPHNTPYDKAVKIANYLANTYTYDINAAPAPFTADAVEYFLFSSQKGYCDVFASSMVVMLRELGIPARLATGFAQGTYEPELHGYRVRELDRHAWAEVYFPKYGWVPFDPTGSSSTQTTSWFSGYIKSLQSGLRLLNSGEMISITLILSVLALLLYVMNGGEIRLRMPLIYRNGRGADQISFEAVRQWEVLCKRLYKLGLAKDASMTPMEYACRASLLLETEENKLAVMSIASRFNALRYSSMEISQDDLSVLRNDVKLLLQSLRHSRNRS